MLALDGQRVLFRFDREVAFAEAGDRDRDAIVVLAGALDVVGRIARRGFKAVEHREQPVEADGRTIEGSKIESSHGISSYLSDMRAVRRMAGPIARAQPAWPAQKTIWERFLASQEAENCPELIELSEFSARIRRAAARPCYKAPAITAPARPFRHETRLDPRQSGARGCGDRRVEDPGRRHPALCPLPPPPGRKGTVVILRAAPNTSKNISRPCATCAPAALPWRRSTGAGRACRIARSPTGARVMCANLPIRDRSRNLHGTDGAARLSAADLRAGAFDGRRCPAPRLP